MANRFGAALRDNMKESENRVEKAINGQPAPIVNNEQGRVGQLAQPIIEVNRQMQSVAQVPVVDAPSPRTLLTQEMRTEQVMKIDDALREDWMRYLSVFSGSLEIGANVKMPEGIDDRLDAISKRMRGVPGAVKMPKKNLILLALWEFVEKYDR